MVAWGVYACVYFCVVCCPCVLQRGALYSDITLWGLSLKELAAERSSRTCVCPHVSLGHSVYFTVSVHRVYLKHVEQVHVHVCVHGTVCICACVHVLVRCTDHTWLLPLDDEQIL